MSIIELLSPIHFFPFFPRLRIIIYKSKTTILSLQREITITSLFRKLTKVSTNNFKLDINEISGRLEICKNTISAKILIYQTIRNFIQCCTRTVRHLLPLLNNILLEFG